MQPDSEQGPVKEPASQLHADVLAKMSVILGAQLADVFANHRAVEAKTGEKNQIGRQNLVEALAHIGVLFQRAPEFNRDQQLQQVAFLEDHLRRVMMESFEGQVYTVIGEVWDEDSRRSIGRLYESRAAPLIRLGRLHGHITPQEVEAKFHEISENVVAARAEKVADSGWNAWKVASDDLRDAAKEIRELQRQMGGAVDAAAATWRWAISIAIALLLFIVSHLVF